MIFKILFDAYSYYINNSKIVLNLIPLCLCRALCDAIAVKRNWLSLKKSDGLLITFLKTTRENSIYSTYTLFLLRYV